MPTTTLLLGDCRTVMATMEPNSVDAIVTDPPYGLSDGPTKYLGEGGRGGFMGKEWDHGVPGVPFWEAALKVAKPGAHLLAFGGTRTHHRLMCAIEDAGWEIRDCLMWLYGSGMPKGHNVSKAIDRQRNDSIRHVCHFLRGEMERQSKTSRDIAEVFGFHSRMVDHWAARDTDSQPSVPTWEQWQQLKSLLHFNDEMDAEVWRLNGRKGKPGDAWYEREVIGQTQYTNGGGNAYELRRGEKVTIDYDITAPATPEAAKWQGFNTNLKPAWEPIIMARKPLSEPTIAQNVLRWGTGAINVDGCRIGTSSDDLAAMDRHKNPTRTGWVSHSPDAAYEPNTQGRWPANLCLDDAAAALLDQMSGERKSGARTGQISQPGSNGIYGNFKGQSGYCESSTGGASRYFARFAHDEDDVPLRMAYVSKASRRDRDEGLEGMPEQAGALRENGRFHSGGRTQVDGEWVETHSEPLPKRNTNPCVKPTALMRWLVRLVTPPNGTVLDPFAGSGSTGKAAKLEGFDFIGIDNSEEYLEIARRRIAAAQPEQPPQPTLFEVS